jgi:hypothetical protein
MRFPALRRGVPCATPLWLRVRPLVVFASHLFAHMALQVWIISPLFFRCGISICFHTRHLGCVSRTHDSGHGANIGGPSAAAPGIPPTAESRPGCGAYVSLSLSLSGGGCSRQPEGLGTERDSVCAHGPIRWVTHNPGRQILSGLSSSLFSLPPSFSLLTVSV